MEEPEQLNESLSKTMDRKSMSFDVNLPKRHRYPNYTYGDITPLCLCKWTRLRRLRGSASEVKVIGSGGGQKSLPFSGNSQHMHLRQRSR